VNTFRNLTLYSYSNGMASDRPYNFSHLVGDDSLLFHSDVCGSSSTSGADRGSLDDLSLSGSLELPGEEHSLSLHGSHSLEVGSSSPSHVSESLHVQVSEVSTTPSDSEHSLLVSSPSGKVSLSASDGGHLSHVGHSSAMSKDPLSVSTHSLLVSSPSGKPRHSASDCGHPSLVSHSSAMSTDSPSVSAHSLHVSSTPLSSHSLSVLGHPSSMGSSPSSSSGTSTS